MKAKTIKAVLRKKTDDWIKSIKDEKVARLVKENAMITGGSIVSMLMQEQVNDFDVYLRTREAAEAVAKYYVDIFKRDSSVKMKTGVECDMRVSNTENGVKIIIESAGIAKEGGTNEYAYFEQQTAEETANYVDQVVPDGNQNSFIERLGLADEVSGDALDKNEEPYRPMFLSANAITLSNKIQIVIRFIGEPDQIHKNYDFVHCTCCWTSWDNNLTLPAAALEAMITKELRYTGSLYPLCSIIRLRKFIARGWTVNAGQILKMCFQLGQLDLNNLKVLEDQLTGCDAFYFLQVIDQLKQKQKEEGGERTTIDETYLMTIVDRLF